MPRKNNLATFWLVLILVLTLFLRFWHLGQNPPSLTWDEAAWGYNAYSLGLTGKDEFGRFLPFNYLESFGDFKPPVYAFLAILPVKLWGLNELAVRFPSALFGSLTVLLTYFLVKELFFNWEEKEKLALWSAFILGISPWHIMLSRAAFEANVASFFIIAGVTAFLRGVRKESWWLILSAMCFALSLQTFNTARIVSPLLLLVLVFVFRKQLWVKKKWLILSGIAGLLIVLPALSFYFTPQASLRFKEVNIFSDSAVVIQANQEMENDRQWRIKNFSVAETPWWSRIIHNRRWGYLRSFLGHYFDHFDPYFLFLTGDGNPKFSTRDMGQLYLWDLPFLVLGTLLLLRKKPRYWWFIFSWLFLGIIPAATARETPHALRIETTLPTWQIIIAFGVVGFTDWLQKQKPAKRLRQGIWLTICLFLGLNFLYFQHGYWRHYPAEFSGEWQYGYRPALEYIKQMENNYDQIWFTDALGRPYIYFLYHLAYPPAEFQSQAQIVRDTNGFVTVKGFDKYRFFGIENRPTLHAGILVIDLPDRVPQKAKIVKEFVLLNGETTLLAYEKHLTADDKKLNENQ
jgi:4-amino-4-deoxy-L-arabinose transferase-like glycosyltransferase